jgi:hypothetical protein
VNWLKDAMLVEEEPTIGNEQRLTPKPVFPTKYIYLLNEMYIFQVFFSGSEKLRFN